MATPQMLAKKDMVAALSALDDLLATTLQLVLGGGGAMILAHNFPISTYDIDAIPTNMSFDEIDPLVKKVAKKLNIPGDWLNPYFSTFTHTLPADYKNRLIKVFTGKYLTVNALGKEDMLIMKIFAGRTKDIPHARQLIKLGADLKIVEKQIQVLKKNNLPNVNAAEDFLDDLLEEF